MPLHLRIDLPDVPGSLARVTDMLAGADADLLAVRVVERSAGRAVDDFILTSPTDRAGRRLHDALKTLPASHRVLALRPVVAVPDENPALDLLTAALAQPHRAIETLVDLTPSAAAADWAVVSLRAARAAPVYSSPGTPHPFPSIAADLPRPVAVAHELGAVVSVPLLGTHLVLLAARTAGPPFVRREVADLSRLAGLATGVSSQPLLADPASRRLAARDAALAQRR